MTIRSKPAGYFFLLVLLCLAGCKPGSVTPVNRITFSMSLPAGWTEDKKDNMYEPNSFVMFENKESCLFIVFIGKKTAGTSIDQLVEKQRQAYLKRLTGAQAGAFDQWSRYKGKGVRLVGKVNGTVQYDTRIFGFENGSNVCAIVEAAMPEDYNKYGRDFEMIRQTFRLK